MAKVPEFIVNTIKPSEAGPGFADTEVAADLCGVAAANESRELEDRRRSLHRPQGSAGNAKSDNGEAVVDAFLSRLGPDARNGTVELDGRIVPSFVTSSGDGYAYAVGPTVVIGYVIPLTTIAIGLDPAATQESAKGAYTRIIAAADGKPISDRILPRHRH